MINYRNNQNLITIITSNFKLDDVAEKFGDRGEAISSRCCQLGYLNVFTDEDMRR
ncbi:hypothetical protein [endosymbiont 'TC1' of Trimyema compressum]|uniref:hypothetical protein n=1 Tax=endosymbiont 'TC1' of Trimyema compressum TaxID=243899 RepID=UPI0013924168|nr:hypothetical protein [endosymbiont 'TC1' of Trimyema compressum]